MHNSRVSFYYSFISLILLLISSVEIANAQNIFQRKDLSWTSRWYDVAQSDTNSYLFRGSLLLGPWHTYFQKLDSQGNLLWNRVYGWPNADFWSTSFSTNNTGELIVAGYIDSTWINSNDVVIYKVDSLAGIYQAKRFIIPWNERANSVITNNDRSYICGSTIDESASLPYRGLIVQTDSSSSNIWAKAYLHNEDLFINSMIKMPDGLIATGAIGINSSSQFDFFAMRIDLNGNIIWSKRYRSSTGYSTSLYEAIETYEGNIILIGHIYDLFSNSVPFFSLIDTLGNVIWSKSIQSSGTYYFKTISKIRGGYCLLAGSGTIIETDSSFNFISASRINPAFLPTNLLFIKQALDGGIIAGGTYDNAYKGYVVKMDSLMNAGCDQSPRNYSTSNHMVTTIPVTLSDTSLNVIELSITIPQISINPTSAFLCQTATSIDENSTYFPLSIYPNPFHQDLFLESKKELLYSKDISVDFYNILGEKFKIDITQDGNKIRLENMSQLASGIYFVSVKFNDGTVIRSKIVKQ